MKRILTDAAIRLQSAIRRLEDLEVIHPGVGLSLSNVVALDLAPALEGIHYAESLADD
jgi:hypothetical protein